VIGEREFGRAPGQLFDERNLVAPLDEFEGDPRRRPLTVDELDAFFAACDERITRASASGRKGTLQAWRDQAMFKIAFGWGLRRRELAMLDVCDFRPDARLPEFGGYAQVHVRHGKSKRGGGPQRRTVLTVFAWAVEVVEQYVAEIRPCFGAPRHPAMFLTERGTRIALASINERFAEIRADAADAARPRRCSSCSGGRCGWLLPGRKPGTHITAEHLRKRLAVHGITSRPGRHGALLALAGTAMRGGEVADFVTASLRVVPRRALDKGYTFRYPELEPALRDLLGR
jgi:integrase